MEDFWNTYTSSSSIYVFQHPRGFQELYGNKGNLDIESVKEFKFNAYRWKCKLLWSLLQVGDNYKLNSRLNRRLLKYN